MQSFTIARIFGIPLKLHWSIILMMFFVLGIVLRDSQASSSASLWFLSYFFLLFICVLLHELGHSLMARRYGIATRDIILSPIGGLARLEFIPKIPIQEFMIAIAGPMVNVILSGLSFLILFANKVAPSFNMESWVDQPGPIATLQFMFWMNGILFAFNLIPAFPMDGGRILRALLSIRLGYNSATRIATAIGKILAVIIFIYAILNQQFVLTLITAFVFITAHQEFLNLKTKMVLENARVMDVMIADFLKVDLTTSLSTLREHAAQTDERSFLVQNEDGTVIGTVPELFLTESRNESEYNVVSDLYSKKVIELNENLSLEKAYSVLNQNGLAVAPVVNEAGQVTGSLDRYTFGEYIKEKTSRLWFQI